MSLPGAAMLMAEARENREGLAPGRFHRNASRAAPPRRSTGFAGNRVG